MERLPSATLQALVACLEATSAPGDLADFPARILTALRTLVPCDVATYNEVDLRQARNVFASDPVEAIPAPLQPVFNHYLGEHPLIAHYARTGDGRAVKLSDLLTRRQFHRLGLHAEFFAPLRVEHQLAVVLPAPAPLLVGVAFDRSRRDFGERERTLLNLARPALSQAYRQAQVLTLLQTGLSRMDQELVLLARSGTVVLASDRAWTWLASLGPRPAHQARLPEPVEQWVRQQRARFDGATLPAPVTPLIGQRATARLVVRFLPGGAASDCDGLLLTMHPDAPTPATLRGLGLTRREADVLAGVAAGHTNAELGERLAISERTVETHVAHLHAKLGVTTRTALVATAFRALRDGTWSSVDDDVPPLTLPRARSSGG
jgi:DNA-binding CsgD family transcriptional regulator